MTEPSPVTPTEPRTNDPGLGDSRPVYFHDLSPEAQRMFLALLSQGVPGAKPTRRRRRK